MGIKPIGDNYLVEPIEQEEVTASGIVLPDSAKEKPEKGKIKAVGTGKHNNQGNLIPMNPELKVGTVVYFKKYSTTEIKDGKKTYYIIDQDGIFAIEN